MEEQRIYKESSLVQYVSGVYFGTLSLTSLYATSYFSESYGDLLGASAFLIIMGSSVYGLNQSLKCLKEKKGIVPSYARAMNMQASKFFAPAVLTFFLEGAVLVYLNQQ